MPGIIRDKYVGVIDEAGLAHKLAPVYQRLLVRCSHKRLLLA
jgi:hypothetical protein